MSRHDDWDERTSLEERESYRLIAMLVCAASGLLVGFAAGVFVGRLLP